MWISDIFPVSLELWISGEEDFRGDVSFYGMILSACLITVNIELDHCAEILFLRLLPCHYMVKLIIFSLSKVLPTLEGNHYV